MKVKVSRILGLAVNVVILAGFSVFQGCKTGDSSGRSNRTPKDEPVILPAGDMSTGGILPEGGSSVVTAPVTATPSGKSYRVQNGDTLSSIASEHGTTWKELADYNNISNPDHLKIGQEIRIPGATGTVTPSKSTSGASSHVAVSSIKQGSYTIQKGDSLSTIAKRSGLTVSEIKTANGLKNDSISAGKKLTIPKKGAAVAPAVAKPAAAKATKSDAVAKKPATPAAPATLMPAPAPLADAAPAVTAVSTGAVQAKVAPTAVPAAAPVATAANAPVYEHVLYPGETLDDVARQYGSSQQEIMKLNNITDAASVKPGTKLLVPIPE